MRKNNLISILLIFLLIITSNLFALNKITAKEQFNKVDSLMSGLSENYYLNLIYTEDVDTLGQSSQWHFLYTDESNNSMRYLSVSPDSVWIDSSTTELLDGAAFISENWINSDSALAIADSRGGIEFRSKCSDFRIRVILSEPLIWDSDLTWTITYINNTDENDQLTIEIMASYIDMKKCLTYYPLQIGNKWAYFYDTYYKDYNVYRYETDTLYREVIGDTIMPNGENYFILKEWYNSRYTHPTEYERLDSLDGKVYRYDTTCDNDELLIDDLFAMPGDTIDSYRYTMISNVAHTYTIFLGDTSVSNFGENIGGKSYQTEDLDIGNYILLENIGIYSHKCGFDFGNSSIILKYAKIGEQKYGDVNYFIGNDEKITAATGLLLADSLINTLIDSSSLMSISTSNVSTFGKSQTWHYSYNNQDSDELYFLSCNAETVWIDSISTKEWLGVMNIDGLWIDSDSAMAIAESQGGRDFRENHENYKIEIYLYKPLIPYSYVEWNIIYRDRETNQDFSIFIPGMPSIFPQPQNFSLKHEYDLANYFNLSWDYPDTSNTDAHLAGYYLFRNFEVIDTLKPEQLSYQEVQPPYCSDNNVYYFLEALYEKPYGVSSPTDTLFERGDAIGIDDVSDGIPERMELKRNYPNPFNPITTIKYSLSDPGFVMLNVYDIRGNQVDILVNNYQPAGYFEVLWNADKFPSGLYFYRLEIGEFTAMERCILLK